MPPPTREQLNALVAQWRRDAEGYPLDQLGALHAAGVSFKKTLEKDDQPKGRQREG